jgi:molecular chaperone GrpE
MTAEAPSEDTAADVEEQVPAEGSEETAPTETKGDDMAALLAAAQDEKQRIAADFANYQKRVNRDKAKWTQDAVRDLVGSMLPVLDNLEHAIASCQGEVKDPEVFRQGVELVQSELLRILKGYQLEPVEAAEGTPFDPDAHQAVSLIPSDEVEEEVVAAVARTGYRLGETVVRPAQVVIKKPS